MSKSQNMAGLKQVLFVFSLSILLTVLYSCGGDDEPNGPDKPPVIVSFTASPSNISPDDSTLLSYVVNYADSLKSYPGDLSLDDLDSGSFYEKPTQTTVYTLVAYNSDGVDSARVTVTVASLLILNGLYYKGEMGSDVLTPEIAMQVLGAGSQPLQDIWIKAAIIEGDGTLSADSVQPGSNDTAFLSYNFNGDLGHAVVRAWVENVDTTDLFLRAKTILPGDLFQGQYILYGDTYTTVEALNGSPDVVDNVGGGILAVVYESTRGAVFLVGEVGAINGQISQMDTVYYIIITSPEGGATSDGLTVGSTYPEMVAALGEPQSSYASDDYPADTILYYDSLGLLFWCNRSDTVVNQVDLLAPNTPLVSLGNDDELTRSISTGKTRRNYKLLP
ncbi:MAG: hypothetical protein ACOYVF_05005 [Candidatus Zixiibacteriota bacterium]